MPDGDERYPDAYPVILKALGEGCSGWVVEDRLSRDDPFDVAFEREARAAADLAEVLTELAKKLAEPKPYLEEIRGMVERTRAETSREYWKYCKLLHTPMPVYGRRCRDYEKQVLELLHRNLLGLLFQEINTNLDVTERMIRDDRDCAADVAKAIQPWCDRHEKRIVPLPRRHAREE